jgi:hypothetical protein
MRKLRKNRKFKKKKKKKNSKGVFFDKVGVGMRLIM